ncbi:uncharacterized protein LOC122014601 isoform X3 [Zingiber officinale]|uniref:uncharacterized protein LOC122014601 isoform X3 n=1 Tax=Zingiber officinale TaxID=94328 RepID=UPI001C4AA1AA|nr:uncharacterized protein LOC122014601 isoform X3 [Zingiber officinale]
MLFTSLVADLNHGLPSPFWLILHIYLSLRNVFQYQTCMVNSAAFWSCVGLEPAFITFLLKNHDRCCDCSLQAIGGWFIPVCNSESSFLLTNDGLFFRYRKS